LSSRLVELFLVAEWHGNVRELETRIKEYVLCGSEEQIVADLYTTNAVQAWLQLPTLSFKSLRRHVLGEFECKAILVSLNRNHWNRKRTARELQISYRALLNSMKELELPMKRKLDSQSTLQTNG